MYKYVYINVLGRGNIKLIKHIKLYSKFSYDFKKNS